MPSGHSGRTSLNAIVERMRAVLVELAGTSAVEFGVGADVPPVRADRARLEEALSRMVLAARSAAEGRPIRIRTSGVRYDEAQPGLRAGWYARLTVACDTDCDAPGRGSAGSLLTLARGVVSHPGGQIRVESQPGGRCFELLIPAVED